MKLSSLAGLRVLVTRPAHQAAALVLGLEDAGAEVSTLPLLAIAPPTDPQATRQMLGAHVGDDFWLFTSANAVAGAAQLHPDGWPAQLFALGQGSARALSHLGHTALAPEGGSSEDLLLWPEFADLNGQRALIVTGEGGRGLLAQTLAARGAEINLARCYRRERVAHSHEQVSVALHGADVLVLTSGEGLEALIALTPPELHPLLHQRALLLPSHRVARAAREAGFAGPLLLPAVMSDHGMGQRLEQWQRAPHNDWP